MKALELANRLENDMESHDGSSLTAFYQGIADEAAVELRRLAEVNAELLGALKRAIPFIGYEGTGDQEAKENAYKAIAKVEEQQ